MYRSLISAIFCIFAGSAAAQCVPPTSVAGTVRPAAELIKTSAVISGGQSQGGRKADEQGPRPATPAMLLLAAVALMSGIALRRYSADKR